MHKGSEGRDTDGDKAIDPRPLNDLSERYRSTKFHSHISRTRAYTLLYSRPSPMPHVVVINKHLSREPEEDHSARNT